MFELIQYLLVLPAIGLCYTCYTWMDTFFRFWIILFHVHISQTLPAAPRPKNASVLSWLVFGHAQLILETRKNGGIQQLLTRWKESLPAHSSCFVIWLGPITPNIVLMDHQLVKTTLVQTKVFQKSFVYDAIRYVVPEGITNAEGDRWKFLRRLVTPCFHNQVVELLVTTMAETGKIHLKRWEQEVQVQKGLAHSINIHALISRLTLNIIMKTTLGRDLTPNSSTYHEFGSMMSYTAEVLVSPLRFLIGSYLYIRLPCLHNDFKARIKRLEKIVHVALSDALAALPLAAATEQDANKPRNLMDIMLAEHQKSGSTFTDKTLCDQLGTFLAAGHDTTAALLSFTINQICRKPNIAKRLRQEADDVLGSLETVSSDTHAVTYEHITQLHYAKACLQEGLRLDSPGPIIARQATKKTSMLSSKNQSVPIPNGTSVWLAIHLLHHDAEHWPEPETYDPERWLTKKTNRPVTSYVPFSYGARNCVGQRFAMLEAATLLSMIVQRFDIRLDENHPPLVRETALVNRPRDGLFVQMSLR